MGFKVIAPNDTDKTRGQLVEAAGEIFVEVGFRAATVRQICERAGTNIASVNYHFGDKETLYKAVLRETHKTALEKYPADYGLTPGATPEERLHAFVFSFLKRIFSDGPSARHGKLMAREMIDPSGALDDIVQEDIRPMSIVLNAIVRDLLGRRVDERKIKLLAMSVVSQVTFYHNCRPVVRRLFPDLIFNKEGIEQLTEHITQFSLAAIHGLNEKKPAARKR